MNNRIRIAELVNHFKKFLTDEKPEQKVEYQNF